jgi:hypothetical protein
MTIPVNQRYRGTQRAEQVVLCPAPLEEQQKIARGIIRRLLIQFHQEWTDLLTRESDETWVQTANALLDRYSHQLYDVVRDLETIIEEDLVVEVRCLSADMIKTTNILIMVNCEEECRKRGEILAKAVLRQAERCLALRGTAEERR